MRVDQLMHTAKQLPCVRDNTTMRDVIYEMSSKGLGMTCVADKNHHLLGLITDGDLRRHMGDSQTILENIASDIMTKQPITIPPTMLAVQALKVMEDHKITSVVVVNDENTIKGVLHLHDLWRIELF